MKVYESYTSQEKADYALKLYIHDICNKLNVVYTEPLADTIVGVINLIKKEYGNKRLKVKDGITIICIAHVLNLDPLHLAARIDVENKYIYSSRKFFVELQELKEFVKTKTVFQHLKQTLQAYCHNSELIDEALASTEKLIAHCEKKGVMLECNSNTLGVACLYFVLLEDSDYQIDIVKFSKTFHVSSTTILKAADKIRTALYT